MSNQATRYWNAQDYKTAEWAALSNARYALQRFRQDGDASGFPKLEAYLSSKSSRDFHSVDLTGYCFHVDMGLTEEEFANFKIAHEATKK